MSAVDAQQEFGGDGDDAGDREHHGASARNRRLRERPVMSGERQSKAMPSHREAPACVSRQAAAASALARGVAPKSIAQMLIASRQASAPICA